MWEAFKILLFCFISILITTLTASWLYLCVIFVVLIVLLYDFDFSTGIEHHAISKLKCSHLKVRNLYTAIFQRDQNNSSLQYTPTMNSINKQTSNFELSRFNKSGNVLSPIVNSANSSAFTSRRLIEARQTSTPLTRTSPWQKNSISPSNNHVRTPAYHNTLLNRSPRYSLSSLTPKSDSNESPVKPTIQTVTGPLLASTRFNVNLGTYTDSKSPGLAGRVVQYNNELSGNQTSTHQVKYGSPGQFPIVQLYKKDLPILNRTRRCTVRIAPPDPVSYNSDHANTILRDTFVQNNVESSNRQNDTEINTNSVLEALKEISRKRIHTNDDEDDISKRQRKNPSSSSKTSGHLNKDGKRMREDTPPKPKESNTTPINNAPKRVCVVNEIESSLSSSRLMRLQQGQKRKSSLNAPDTNKQRRISNGELVSKETQTTVTNNSKTTSSQNNTQKTTSTAAQTENEISSGMLDLQYVIENTRRRKKSNEIRTTRDIDEENSTLPFTKPRDVPTKSIFSEAPLEIMKENKLSIMIGALGGHEPELIPLPDMTLSALKKKSADNTDGADVINKEVVSILSPKNKAKHDKHVTFAIPSTDSSNSTSSVITLNQDKTVVTTKAPDVSTVALSSTSSTVTIIITETGTPNAVPKTSSTFSSPITFGTSLQPNVSNPITFSSVTSAVNATTISNSINNNFMFGAVSSPTSKPNISSLTTTTNATNIITSSSVEKSENTSNKTVIDFGSTPTFNFGSNNTTKQPLFGGLVPANNLATALKSSTDENKSLVPVTATFSFTSLPAVAASPAVLTTASATTPAFTAVSSTQAIVAFGTKSSAFTSAPNINNVSTAAPINFSTGTSSSLLPVNSNLTTTNPVTNTNTSNMFNFGAITDTKTSTSPNFSFGSPVPSSQNQPKSGGFKFDLGKSVATKSAVISKMESPKTTLFGTTGSTNLNKSGTFTFGPSNPSTTSSSAFNTTSTAIVTPAFGVPSTAPSTPTFGTPNKSITAGMFGTPTTTASTGVFGAPSTTSAVGIFATTTTTTAAAFGVSTTTMSSGAFGTPNATTTTPAFGSTNTSSTAGVFGNTAAASAFGTPKTTENAPGFSSFGSPSSTQNPGFGTATQNTGSTFGFGATPTTVQNNAFGSNTPATTASAFTFGSTSATKPFTFGSTTTATTTASTMFGSNNTAPATNLFGGNTSSGFGTGTGVSGTFGPATTTASSTFGQQSSNVFGAASSNFGASTATSGSVFGSNTNNTTNNTFGASSTPNVFGAPTQQPNTFGAGTTSNPGNVFGITNNNQNTSGAFGATNTNNNNTFGATSSTSFGAGISNFGSPATQTPSQPSSVFAFGGGAASSSSTSNAFQFGANNQTPKQSGFNFSSNTNTPNINFGSGSAPAFSATPGPAFGSSVPGQFNAPAPSTGMFNIGSGSTAPKQRPMIKARRRN